MNITVKVFPTLRTYLRPELADKVEFTLLLTDLPGESKTVLDLIEYLHLPPKQIGQIILNGHIKWDKSIALQANDRVVLQPPIGGG
jgi:molybdopterin converting factor small subunit